MLVPVILILGVLWLTFVLVFVAACRMAANGGRGAASAPPDTHKREGLTFW